MSLIEIPPELQTLIQVVIEIVVVFVLTQLAKWGLNLQEHKAAVTAALFSAVMVILNALLAKVPLNLEGIVSALLNLLVVVLGAFGLYKQYRRMFPKK